MKQQLLIRLARLQHATAQPQTAEQHVVIIYDPDSEAQPDGIARVMLPVKKTLPASRSPSGYIKRIVLTHEHSHATAPS